LEEATWIFERYAADPDVAYYMTWRPHTKVDTVLAFLQDTAQRVASGRTISWVIERRDDETPMGMIDAFPARSRAHLGYVLGPAFHRRGFMSEAAACVVDWLMRHDEIFRVEALADVDNVASWGVMEKIGMVREGRLRRYMHHPNVSDTPRDLYMYAIVKP